MKGHFQSAGILFEDDLEKKNSLKQENYQKYMWYKISACDVNKDFNIKQMATELWNNLDRDGLVQYCCNSSANVLELQQYGTKPLTCTKAHNSALMSCSALNLGSDLCEPGR